jgi:sarcosine oxidase, subunit alpha
MPRLPHAATDRVIIRWEGRPVEARAGDSVAAALYAAGIRTLAYSRKFHRPRGLSGSFVAGALARVDGVPNVRLDGMAVRDGLDVRAQNVWPGQRIDLLRVARLLPRRWLRAGFEHPRWLPSGTRTFDRWEGFLRFMAGGGDPPDARVAGAVLAGERLAVDTVVVGGGPAGLAAAAHATSLGRSVIVVSRSTQPDAFAAAMGMTLPALPPSVRVLAGTETFALYRHGTLVGCAPRDGGAAVLIDAKEVVLATGRRSFPISTCRACSTSMPRCIWRMAAPWRRARVASSSAPATSNRSPVACAILASA